jgi:hypothetical protein
MAFDEVQFPVNISQGARGGPRRRTQVVALSGGDEERNASWLNSRREYDISYGIRSADAMASVVAFFEARNGMLNGFRFKDWSDYRSCAPSTTPGPADQRIGTGTGILTTFQMSKVYASGSQSWTRTITKPVFGTALASTLGPELVVAWDNPRDAVWGNNAVTGANSGAVYGAFANAYQIGNSGGGTRQNFGGSAVSAGVTYTVRCWIRQGTSTQAGLRLRCAPGNLLSGIKGPYNAPVVTDTAAGAVSNIIVTNLGGGVWLWSMDVTIGAGLTDASVGVQNVDNNKTIIMFAVSIRPQRVVIDPADFTVDPATGILTFATAPGDGHEVWAGFEFDVPVRFDTDMIDVALKFERLGSINSIPLIEVRR